LALLPLEEKMTSEDRLTFVVPGDAPPQIQRSPHLDRLSARGEVVLYTDRPASMADQIERVREADVILNTRSSVRWPAEALEGLPKLRLIATCSIGTDNIDLEAAGRLGVAVSNQPGRTAGVVAEHIVALMFATAKRAAFQTAEMKAGRWTKMENVLLRGKTMGVVGTGSVGAEVARLAQALGMHVIAWTFHPTPQRASDLGVTFVELDDLLRQADVVSLHVRLTDDSAGMLGARELRLMKQGALIVNAGRGELVDTAALVEALESGHLAGAGLDVFDTEPLPPDHPLLACRQVVLTPHVADATPEGADLLNEGVVDNVLSFLDGNPRNLAT